MEGLARDWKIRLRYREKATGMQMGKLLGAETESSERLLRYLLQNLSIDKAVGAAMFALRSSKLGKNAD
jgi:hypothetical protein